MSCCWQSYMVPGWEVLYKHASEENRKSLRSAWENGRRELGVGCQGTGRMLMSLLSRVGLCPHPTGLPGGLRDRVTWNEHLFHFPGDQSLETGLSLRFHSAKLRTFCFGIIPLNINSHPEGPEPHFSVTLAAETSAFISISKQSCIHLC